MEKQKTESYPYPPLEPGHIRLLHILPESTLDDIRCTLVSIPHKPVPNGETREPFIALSYCWGDPTPVGSISIDGTTFRVAQNLLDFLRNLFEGKHMFSRDSKMCNIPLWIDAICINQADDAEKSAQVQRMGLIYSAAMLVLAWLGKEQNYTSKAFMSLKLLSIGGEESMPPSVKSLVEQGRDSILELSDNPYFSRTWIIQEVLCGDSQLMLFCGPHLAPFGTLYSFSALRNNKVATQGPITARVSGGLNICVESLLYTMDRSRRALESSRSTTFDIFHAFQTIILDHKNKQCSDPRDKIFAFLGMPICSALEETTKIKFQGDYSMTVDEIAVATLSYFDLLELSACTDRPYSGFTASFVVLSLFQVDLASDDFRAWLQSRIHRNQDGVAEFVTESGKQIAVTSYIEQLLAGEITDMVKLLTGRALDAVSLKGHNYGDDEPREPKRYTRFPAITHPDLKGARDHVKERSDRTLADTSLSEESAASR